MKQSKNSDADFVKFSIVEEAFFIRCFAVTDIPKAQIISTKPELKLGQHHVDKRIVSVHTVVRFRCLLRLSLHVIT